MRIEGLVAVIQLLETPFVKLINFASLVTTNAARHRFVAGKNNLLLEFGLFWAYVLEFPIFLYHQLIICNCVAGKLFGILLCGTHSHAFVSSFTRLSSLAGVFGETNQSELAAFVSYALAFLDNFLALVNTYDVMRGGIPNFCAFALALNDKGVYKAKGIRLDFGNLAYLSCEAMNFFHITEKEFHSTRFGKINVNASNNLNEETLDALNKHGHEVDSFGIGTNLVTCFAQPALGCVFKLVEINNQPRIKLSEDISKV
ncbi:putative nicotinate phosphoribosyltransferase [Helianthus annuus]|nr:putative nicotinate phosphoribosyltransferase [Helianthus annuus]KAJ0440121.1 putative nicotinate phosphoribosyltransferase [Helianthus annuus]KAJ0445419.1 putative nicotinate phosphoribosyltransferase [Helianthus annuus]KAJ0642903.1 putative nicotinate phosphoribosyltransferase [Helianthus annuus]KAJ0823509.1 putative nicotinate phosphoribosyltransferase [Helianthus annuus]